MARTWFSVTVELLGGRGEDLWPWPGRIFAVGPSHTFLDLANAIDGAFTRWDRSHLSVFTLADGRVITDADTGAEIATSGFGPIITPIDITTATIGRMLRPGAEFQYTFDLGDDWTHRCVIGEDKVDPLETLGIRPKSPLPYWGWGNIPDQYGRRWADDDGESKPPPRPRQPHPMQLHGWPAHEQVPAINAIELRQANVAGDADRFLAAVTGCDIDDALQQVGSGIPMALEHRRKDAESVALAVINRLTWRGGAGDSALADDLLAGLRREPRPGRVVPVDLEMLSITMDGDLELSTGGYIDLRTGTVYSDSEADPMIVGDDVAIDVEEDPDRWLRFESTGSRDGWQDMAAFAEGQRDRSLRQRPEQAIEGKGAFRRFRDLVEDLGLAERWNMFSTDRQLGRAREFLAAEGIRVG